MKCTLTWKWHGIHAAFLVCQNWEESQRLFSFEEKINHKVYSYVTVISLERVYSKHDLLNNITKSCKYWTVKFAVKMMFQFFMAWFLFFFYASCLWLLSGVPDSEWLFFVHLFQISFIDQELQDVEAPKVLVNHVYHFDLTVKQV